MRRRYPKARPSKAAQDAYRRLLAGSNDDSSRLEKGIDLEPPAIDLTHDAGEEGDP